jgi:hypothetical protein
MSKEIEFMLIGKQSIERIRAVLVILTHILNDAQDFNCRIFIFIFIAIVNRRLNECVLKRVNGRKKLYLKKVIVAALTLLLCKRFLKENK